MRSCSSVRSATTPAMEASCCACVGPLNSDPSTDCGVPRDLCGSDLVCTRVQGKAAVQRSGM